MYRLEKVRIYESLLLFVQLQNIEKYTGKHFETMPCNEQLLDSL
jgi:hypothetical protein